MRLMVDGLADEVLEKATLREIEEKMSVRTA